MRVFQRYSCFCLLLFLVKGNLHAQSAAPESQTIFTTEYNNSDSKLVDSSQLFIIRDISITGNNKTKPSIIIRELSFHINDGFPLNIIVDKFYESKKQLMNSGLFRNVVVSLKRLVGYEVYVNIEVEEKWYIYPVPFLHPVDKSFHQWWVEKDRNFDRVNYGVKLTHNNFTGLNDKLDLKFTHGYTHELSLSYHGLFLDREMKWSASAGIGLGHIKEINYITEFNKQVAFSNDHYLDNYVHSFLLFTYRPAIKTRHTFAIGYNYDNTADTISKLNPHFSDSHNVIRFLSLSYRLSYYDVDFIPYPTSGYAAEVTVAKQGFRDPINLWQLTAKGSGTWPLSQKYFFNVSAVGMLKLPFKQPYITQQFIGYGDNFIQGYEYYVIDGVAGGYTKATFSRNILNTHVRIPSKRIKQLNFIPIKLYAKTFLNAGYVLNSNNYSFNSLNNKMLYSGGIGLDIVAFTDFIIKLEWSFNQIGQNGLYLHRINYF